MAGDEDFASRTRERPRSGGGGGSASDDDEDDDKREQFRGDDISKRKKVRDKLLKVFRDVEKGFEDQDDRYNDIRDNWDIYNCKLTQRQFYEGNSRIFVPVVHNAINARKTRFTNQVFPTNGRYVEVISEDRTRPDRIAALLEHYVRKAQMRTQVMPALMKAGDIEGQYNLLVSWCDRKRHVTHRITQKPELEEGMPNEAAEEVETIEEQEVRAMHPSVEVLSDTDVLVLPAAADSIDEAIHDMGGSVSIIRRLSKAGIRRLIRDKAIRKDMGEELLDEMEEGKKGPSIRKNLKKEHADAAGIKSEGDKNHALVYRTWTIIEVGGEDRLCEAYYGGKERILGARLNPLWSDRVPLLSVPVEKIAGSFKGLAKMRNCRDLQYFANDTINQAADSAGYSMMPIIMTDPEKNPRTGSMILSMSAIWETSPKDTQFAQFPPLWEKGFELVNACKAEVSQTLNVSPAAITQGVGNQLKSKRNQAEIAQEQMIDILTTADSVTVVEDILSQMLALFLELDHQYREDEVTVRAMGDTGRKANFEKIPPIQMDQKYQFKWYGVEQTRSAQQMQQQISFINVVTNMQQLGPDVFRGYKLNLQPFVTQGFENVFGPRLTPQIWETPQDQMPLPAAEENHLLELGHEVETHPEDEDQQHIMIHKQAAQQLQQQGQQTRQHNIHIWMHMQQMKRKQQAQMQQMMGQPPGGQQQGGGQKKPQPQARPGAQNKMPRGGQGPAGMIPRDQMKDPHMMPGKIGGGRL